MEVFQKVILQTVWVPFVKTTKSHCSHIKPLFSSHSYQWKSEIDLDVDKLLLYFNTIHLTEKKQYITSEIIRKGIWGEAFFSK